MHKWPILLFFQITKSPISLMNYSQKEWHHHPSRKKKELNLFLQNFSKFSEHLIAATPVYNFTSYFLSPQQIEIIFCILLTKQNNLFTVAKWLATQTSNRYTQIPIVSQYPIKEWRIGSMEAKWDLVALGEIVQAALTGNQHTWKEKRSLIATKGLQPPFWHRILPERRLPTNFRSII